MAYWDAPPIPRDQLVLIETTLSDRIPEDHPVRLFWEILGARDWSAWESRYHGRRGRPPIPPAVMASVVLYGLTRKMRSSRFLEWACANAVDFMWLTEGRCIDHSTICGFRTEFKDELKDLFKQIGRIAMGMGLTRLNEVALDGTRVKANSSPHATATAKTLEARLEALDEAFERLVAEAEAVDQQEGTLCEPGYSPTKLPAELADYEQRREALKKAIEAARAMDAKREKRSDAPKKPAKVPVADPEAALLPHKGGGHGPNYNPMVATDGHRGFIVDSDVINHSREAETVLPTMERIQADLGESPKRFLADKAFNTGENLSRLEANGTETFMPVEKARIQADNPAQRSNPTEAVAPADWPKLPINPQSKKLDRAGFIYDTSADCYSCPMGRRLDFVKTTTDRKDCGDSTYRMYRSQDCTDCPLAWRCLGKRSKQRTVSHDQHEPARQALADRIRSKAGLEIYARRAPIAETPNAFIKEWMGVRQFLHRGLDKVQTEWLWACTAFNLNKLVRELARLRAKFAVPL